MIHRLRFIGPSLLLFALTASYVFAQTQGQTATQAPPGAQAPPPNQPPGAQKPGAPAPTAMQQQQQQRRRMMQGLGGRDYKEVDPAVLERGQKLFVSTCGFCHGANAKGGETGPDLLRSVVVLDDEHGEKIGEVVLNGRPSKGMPKFALSQQQISDIADFLHDRIKAAALRGTYQILNIVVGDPKAGETYFNGHCTSCHSVTGDLAHVGSKYDAVGVQQHIVMPRDEPRYFGPPAPERAPVTVTVTSPSGEALNGTLVHVDDFTVTLKDANGDLRTFARDGDTPKVELHDPLKGHTELLAKYTDADIHNLTAYLVTLK